ncbi:MAG: hypothetical protein JWN88_1760 [Frankiales bacterium]|jgi:hypothetical protein|nr:hypothetical protein [Frankiales bacterium]
MRHEPSRSPVSIVTSARLSHSEDIALRQQRYVITQSLRLVCIVLATALPLPVVLRALLLVGAIALPWFGVVMANAGPTRPRRRKTALRASAGAAAPYAAIEPGRVIDAER